MNVNKSISILGCGWLGLPLALKLRSCEWKVKGSTTSVDKIDLLRDKQIDPYLIHLHNVHNITDSSFWNSDILLINVPPSLRKQSNVSYLEQMTALAGIVPSSPIKNVIFISSTSVYPENNQTIVDVTGVDENSALYQSEQLFTTNTSFKTTVIRFGGLIGPGRHPSRFFSGKKDIPNGKAPVNLIELEDCLDIIEAVLRLDKFGKTYHAAAPTHPTRSQFYGLAAMFAGAELPEFKDELLTWKIIDPAKLEDDLEYFFVHPNLIDYLEENHLIP